MSRFDVCTGALALACALFSVAPISIAAAQVTLTGTYLRYVSVGSDGTFIARFPSGEMCPDFVCRTPGTTCESGVCITGQSMQYGETASPPVSCDAFFPGSPQESFTIEASAGGAHFVATNTGVDGVPDEVTTTSGPTLSGRTIIWRGRLTSGSAIVDVEQTVRFETDDRAVQVTVQLTNAGSVALSNVYYLRNADPDHGQCNIGGDFATRNDVRRQPPASDSALATAEGGDGAGPGRRIVMGLGAHDSRARVHNGGFANTDASGEWTSPHDGDGASADEAVDIIFREPMLAVGASTTFEFFYVWGTTVTEIESRFDELGFPTAPCTGVPEGGACAASGRVGVCRSGRCCTGCWDGTRCRTGTSSTQCGVAGTMCRSCADTDACTSDVCTAGVCTNPLAPAGTACDDGLFCTSTDTCDGRGTCMGGGPRCDDGASCTSDTCDEATDSCTFTMTGGCIIGGVCVGEGTTNPSYPCQICDPMRNSTDWSLRPVGTLCGTPRCAAGRFYPAGMCGATGTCVSPPSIRCTTGRCADSMSCEMTCLDTGCADGEWCAPSGACQPMLDDGAVCIADPACRSGHCVDGVCCDGACEATCEACDLAGAEGVCTAIPPGEDPDVECRGSATCGAGGVCIEVDAGPMPGDGGPPPSDAGADADGGSDAGAGADAGVRPLTRGGCGCAVSARGPGAPLAALLLAALACALRRRRDGASRPRPRSASR